MAICKDGILGGFSGKVGNIGINLKWGSYYAGCSQSFSKPPTEKQRFAETEVSLAIEFTKPFRNYPTVQAFWFGEKSFDFLYSAKCHSGAR